MAEQKKDQQQQPAEPTQAELYGQQGNQGQYGQGQYDMNGNPDPHGTQAQQINPKDHDARPRPKDPHDALQSPTSKQSIKDLPRD